MTITLPTVMTKNGLLPQPPADLKNLLLATVASIVPGYTANLPAILIEDISSTDTYAIAQCDSARVEFVNSITPRGANEFLLNEIGQMLGVPQGLASRTSVGVVFSGSANFPIPPGFTVSDGVYAYTVQEGGIINDSGGGMGQSSSLYCVADVDGRWAVPAGSVTSLVTSLPTGIVVTCSNPQAGLAGAPAESPSEYRADVMLAQHAASQGMASYAKTLIRNVDGVQPRLVAFRQVDRGYQIIVGGGDDSEVANAIYEGVLDFSTLQGSVMSIADISQANPGVITTVLNHGYTTGQHVTPHDVLGMTAINGLDLTIVVLDEKSFRIGIDTSGFSAYTTGGFLTPNLRNQSVSIQDYPDIYLITYIRPPPQVVAVSLLWNTSLTSFVSDSAIQQLAQPALADYINSVPVGQPLNLYEMQSAFTNSIVSVLSPDFLTRMVFSVSINGVGVAVSPGTGLFIGDPESYFTTEENGSQITVARG